MFIATYGMLCNPNIMQRIAKSARPVGVCAIDNYVLRMYNHLTLEEDSRETSFCVLWDISEEDIDGLDAVEGCPDYYQRKTATAYILDTNIHKFNEYECQVYLMNDSCKANKPSGPGLLKTKYIKDCIEGYKAFGVPLFQIRNLEGKF